MVTIHENNAPLTTAEHVKSMLESEGWKYIKEKFDERILDLQNIHNLNYENPESLSTQLASRKMAVQQMYDWYKSDVLGFVEQQELNNQSLALKPDPYIDLGASQSSGGPQNP